MRSRRRGRTRVCLKQSRVIAESLAFLPSPSRSFSRFARIGTSTIAPGRLSGNIRPSLDSVLQSHPELQDCVAYCTDCGIRFLTHPRNAGRRDLRCPFGCREHHRRQRSCQRSTAYYQTAAGKAKKKRLNARRQAAGSAGRASRKAMPSAQGTFASPARSRRIARDGRTASWKGWCSTSRVWPASPMLPYVRMVVSLIEGVALHLPGSPRPAVGRL